MHSSLRLDIHLLSYSIVPNPWNSLSRGSFNVLVGMDRLSKWKFVIVCHEKVVRIPLKGDEILRVHGERTQGVVKTLLNMKVDEPKLSDISVLRDFVDMFQMQELSEQLQELQDKVLELLRNEKLYAKFTKSEELGSTYDTIRDMIILRIGRVKLRRVRAMSMTIQSSVKDKILATSSKTSKVENGSAEMLRDLDQQMEKRADDGKANVVTDALSRKERVKPRRVREKAMTIQYGVRGMILTTQSEAFKQENVQWVGSEMDKAHASRYLTLQKVLETQLELSTAEQPQADGQSEHMIQTLGRYNEGMSLVLWAEIGESSLIGLQLVQETTDKVVVYDEISNLVDLHMDMFGGGWKWQDLQGLLWLDHHKSMLTTR
ncbi:hypothetical protein Tco_1001679 [Tanacetum coccineum]